MKSNNPVFNRSPEFSGQSANAYGNQTYPGNGASYPRLRPARATPTRRRGAPARPGTPTQVDQGRMTIDSVVQKTAISLVVVVVAAAATWFMTPEISQRRPTSARSTSR